MGPKIPKPLVIGGKLYVPFVNKFGVIEYRVELQNKENKEAKDDDRK